MQVTLKFIAEYVNGRLIGEPDQQIFGIGSLDDATEGQITFLANQKLAAKVAETKASAVLLPPGANGFGKNVIETANPYLAFAKLLTFFCQATVAPLGIMPGALIAESARLGSDISVYPGACIGERVVVGDRVVIHPGVVLYEDVVIGNDVVLHANVSIRERCRVGSNVTIHNGAVIGSDGFGYVPEGRRHFKIPQIGTVVIEDDVEIGANTTIDRAALDVTLIRRGTKIDNLVQIAHNCIIGEDCALAAQVGLSGSTRLGRNVIMGGQAGTAGHLTIADNVMIGGRGGILSDIKEPGVFSGAPAVPHKDWLKSSALSVKLPDLKKTIAALEKRVAELETLTAADAV